MIKLDFEKVREDFPIVSKVIYMDSAASSLTPRQVIEEISRYYLEYRANVHRGVHRLSQEASEKYELAHFKVADFIGAKFEREIIFTKNTTESINFIANSIELDNRNEIITTYLEHHSNFLPWLRLRKKGFIIKLLKPKPDGTIEIADFEKLISNKTKLVAVTHVSNVLGNVIPVEEMIKISHDFGALCLIDGAQSVPHIPINVKKMNCDFMAFSGHKMLGPTGIGVLYIKEEHLNGVEPFTLGGGTIEDVSIDSYKLTRSPERFEAGTPPIAPAIGLGAAVDYLAKIGMENVQEHENKLSNLAFKGLSEIDNVEVYGPAENKVGIISFNIPNLNPHDVALVLDNIANIMIRSGHHCALPLMKEILKRPNGTARASLYIYNTIEEVKKFIDAIKEISKI